MKSDDELIKATADALYREAFTCPERDMIEGCSACQSRAEEGARIAVSAVLTVLRERSEDLDGLTKYLGEVLKLHGAQIGPLELEELGVHVAVQLSAAERDERDHAVLYLRFLADKLEAQDDRGKPDDVLRDAADVIDDGGHYLRPGDAS